MKKRVLLIAPGGLSVDEIRGSYGTISIEIKPLSGVPSIIEDAYGLALALSSIINALKDISKIYDAIIISCFEDLGVDLPKKFGIPVIGLSDASIISGSLHGRRFSVLAPNHYVASLIYRRILEKGLAPSLASIRVVRPLEGNVTDSLIAEAQRAIEEDDAQAIVLGHPAWGKFSEVLSQRIRVPIIDPLSAALGLLETLLKRKEVKDA